MGIFPSCSDRGSGSRQGATSRGRADGYLSKPIKGDTPQGKPWNLFLAGPPTEPTMDDEEILIDFTDDDSGDMTGRIARDVERGP